MLKKTFPGNVSIGKMVWVAAIACLTIPIPATAQVPKVKVATLASPSTGAWMAAIMEARQIDIKHGVDVEWIEQPTLPSLYNDFAAGSYPIATGGMMTYANQYARGVKLKFFATYQLFGTSVIINTERAPDIRSLKDLGGKEMAATLASENYKAMTIYLLWAGVDLKSLKTRNFAHPGVAAELRSPTGTAQAGVLWGELPTSVVMADPKKFKDIVSVDELEKLWRQKTGTEHHWLLGSAVQDDFARSNAALLQRVYSAMKEAVDWFNEHTDEALKLVSEKTKNPVPVLSETVKAGRVKFLTTTAESQEKAIMELLKISAHLGFVTKLPDAGFYYRGLR
ncbi:MAG: ABC transporter substrate-binding protein [Deltaproteobacteria bacterium]|nr:ABC transporter substrate-binding protein [Deltaproteobacteria bacterium]